MTSCQKTILNFIYYQIVLSIANVFPKELAMKLYEACDICDFYVYTCVRIKSLKFSEAKSNDVIKRCEC